MTSGTPGCTSVCPRSATMRTTSAMFSGSQAISVRMDQVPTDKVAAYANWLDPYVQMGLIDVSTLTH